MKTLPDSLEKTLDSLTPVALRWLKIEIEKEKVKHSGPFTLAGQWLIDHIEIAIAISLAELEVKS